MKPTIFSVALAIFGAFSPAQDDRDRTTPTATAWAPGQSTAQIAALVSNGYRLTDIEIESQSPWTFTVAAVANTGAYAKAWWYLIGATTAQLSSSISANNARIVDIETYDDNGTARHVAILISNTGADAKAWWWGVGQTTAQVNSSVSANNGRLTSLKRYSTAAGDRFTSVMISNTGADARAWAYLFGASAAAISQNTPAGGRVYGIERVASDSYDAILVATPGLPPYHPSYQQFLLDRSATSITQELEYGIARIADIERYTTPLGTRYLVTLMENANPLEQAVRNRLATLDPWGTGSRGFFLKEVNGPVLAAMRPDTAFVPDRSVTAIHHVHALRQVSLGQTSLSNQVNKPISCGNPGSLQTLASTLRQMMEQSDAMATLAVANLFGLASIQGTAQALGMANTQTSSDFGCSVGADTTTLRDLARLHEAVANGFVGAQRANLYDLMLNGSADGFQFPNPSASPIDARINARAIELGMPNSVRDAFRSQMLLAYRSGAKVTANPLGGAQQTDFSDGGFLRLPFKSASGAITEREYTWGFFCVYDHAIIAGAAVGDIEADLVWDRVKAALDSWDNHTGGTLTALAGAGCSGSAGIPAHTANGTPEIGQSVNYSVGSAPPVALAVALFGFDNVSWNGAPLPFDFAPLGAPGCRLRVNAVISEPRITNVAGAATVTIAFPNDPSLIGAQMFTQYLVVDAPANALGLTLSGAMRTILGGWL